MTPLTQRLRGIYTVPVNDGDGLLDCKDTFTRTFEVPPINHEAAACIESQEKLITELYGLLNAARVVIKFGQPAKIAELLPRITEVLNKVEQLTP